MFCEKCGTQLPDGSKFCASCGTPTEPKQASPVQQAAPSVNPQQATQTAPQPVYTQPPRPNYAPPPPPVGMTAQGTAPIITIGNYIVMFIIAAIPIVGLVMLFVWGFGSYVNPNKKNYARAVLIMAAIVLVLYIFLLIALGSLFASIFSRGYSGGYY